MVFSDYLRLTRRLYERLSMLSNSLSARRNWQIRRDVVRFRCAVVMVAEAVHHIYGWNQSELKILREQE